MNIRVVTEWYRNWLPATFSPQIGADYTIFMLFEQKKQKIAAEVAASVKNFLISIYRISEVIKRKSAAALSTIAATFCSIIIETHCTNWKVKTGNNNDLMEHFGTFKANIGEKSPKNSVKQYFC